MIEAIAASIGVLIPMAGWVLAIQSKVTAHEVLIVAQKELLESKLDGIDQRLERIERYLNGHLSKD